MIGDIAEALAPLLTPEQVQERLRNMAARALVASRDDNKPKLVREICHAYLSVHRNLAEYLLAAIRHPDTKEWIELGNDYKSGGFFQPFNMGQFICNVPAMWEFGFTVVIGTVHDANWCASQYAKKWTEFIGVKPVAETLEDGQPVTIGRRRIPIFHKPNSRFRQGYEGRLMLKCQLGSKHRSLVNFARGETKQFFLEQFHMPPPDRNKQQRIEYKSRSGHVQYGWSDVYPYKSKICVHIEAWELLKKTGYTPEEFWQMCKDPTKRIQPRKPQLELI